MQDLFFLHSLQTESILMLVPEPAVIATALSAIGRRRFNGRQHAWSSRALLCDALGFCFLACGAGRVDVILQRKENLHLCGNCLYRHVQSDRFGNEFSRSVKKESADFGL